jgi:hypothetical protein
MEQASRTPHPTPVDPAIKIRRSILKLLPDGTLINLRVQVSSETSLDDSYAADGWDIIRAGSISVRLRLE